MSNVVNLGRARKRKRKAAAQRSADENAIRHGRTKAEKARERLEQEQLRATVDGARRQPALALAPGPHATAEARLDAHDRAVAGATGTAEPEPEA